ncbi:MAG: XRE family transcriptional regulator [Spirochaetaceae bacterium]|nr:XRE family transcriptional regulator [Spirochaetaceae bacterium]
MRLNNLHTINTYSDNTYSDVWEAISDTPAEAANLRIRSQLMIALTEYVKRQAITQQEAGKLLGVPRSRVSELVNGKISKFSIDRLVNMASRVNLETHIVVKQNGRPLSILPGV